MLSPQDTEAIVRRIAYAKKQLRRVKREETYYKWVWEIDYLTKKLNPTQKKSPPARPYGKTFHEAAPEGKTWCTRCQNYLPLELFYRDKHQPSGWQNWCKYCIKAYDREATLKRQAKRREEQRNE